MEPSNKISQWCRAIHDVGVVRVAQALGGISLVNEGRSGLTPCPACGDAVRGKSTRDRRGPVGITRDGLGWCCHRCGAKGDAVTLASYLSGAGGKASRQVRDACVRAGILRLELPMNSFASANSDKPVVRAPATAPKYPPEDEVRGLVRQLFAIDHAPDAAAMEWLRSRGLDAQLIANAGLCMGAMRDAPMPLWARCKGIPWSRSGHRLILPLCDVEGRMRGVHARQIKGVRGDMPKGTNPAGFDIRGLVLACPRARTMLAKGTRPDGVVITEGVPDWLTWFQHFRKQEKRVAVIGIVAGAWTEAFAQKLPQGSRVMLAGHDDPNGAKYVVQIVASLRKRVAAGTLELRVRKAS